VHRVADARFPAEGRARHFPHRLHRLRRMDSYPRSTRSLRLATQSGIKQITHAVSQEIKPHHRRENADSWKHGQPPVIEKLTRRVNHGTPLWRRRNRADADEA